MLILATTLLFFFSAKCWQTHRLTSPFYYCTLLLNKFWGKKKVVVNTNFSEGPLRLYSAHTTWCIFDPQLCKLPGELFLPTLFLLLRIFKEIALLSFFIVCKYRPSHQYHTIVQGFVVVYLVVGERILESNPIKHFGAKKRIIKFFFFLLLFFQLSKSSLQPRGSSPRI